MIIAYTRFLERRLERDQAAAERLARVAPVPVDVIDVVPVIAVAPIPEQGHPRADEVSQSQSSEKRFI